MPPAISLTQIRRNLRSKPLEMDELDTLFIETSDARAPLSIRKRIAMALDDEESPAKILFAGHGGAGKSTELVKFRSEHGDRFTFVTLSMSTEGNLNVDIESLLVLIVEATLRKLNELDLRFDNETLEEIYAWFDEVFVESKEKTEVQGEVKTGIDTSGSLFGAFLGLTAKLQAAIRSGTSNVSTRIRRENGKLSQLTMHCHRLLQAAQTEVFKEKTSHLVLIVEDLDKISLEDADQLFIQNPAPIADLPIRAIFTAPIFLQYSPRASRLEGYFQPITMPMIKVKDQKDQTYQPGTEVIRKILAQRLDLEESIEPEAINFAIKQTGGVLRHLFETLTVAAMVAEVNKAPDSKGLPITKTQVQYGLAEKKNSLLKRIGTAFLPKEFGDITTDELYQRLYDFKKGRRAEPDEINILLLQAHALIEYNGEGWHRVHPLVDEYLDERKTHAEP